MNESQFLELLTGLAKIAKPLHRDTVVITDMDVAFKDVDIDSLDTLMLVIYSCELYGIPEEVGKQCNPVNPRQLWTFIREHKTQEVTDVAQALEACA